MCFTSGNDFGKQLCSHYHLCANRRFLLSDTRNPQYTEVAMLLAVSKILFPLFPAQIELKTRKDFIVERNARSGVKLWRICGPSDHGRGKNPMCNRPERRVALWLFQKRERIRKYFLLTSGLKQVSRKEYSLIYRVKTALEKVVWERKSRLTL